MNKVKCADCKNLVCVGPQPDQPYPEIYCVPEDWIGCHPDDLEREHDCKSFIPIQPAR